jgi:hypothetical protein
VLLAALTDSSRGLSDLPLMMRMATIAYVGERN